VDIDLTDDTDAGFYAAGYRYVVMLCPDETVDGQTLTGVPVAYFEIGVAEANVTQSLGETVYGSDLTAASATSSTVTLPTTDSAGTAIPDDDRYLFTKWRVVDGTGEGQLVVFTTAGAGARQYNVLSGTMPVQLDNTSELLLVGSVQSRLAATSHGGTGTTVDFPTFQTTITGDLTGSVGSVAGNVGGSVGSVATAVAVSGDAATMATQFLTMTELDGAVYRYTVNALEQAPAGGGGSTDWTSDERTAIRSILGIPASGTTPEDPTAGILDTIRDDTSELQTDWANGGRLDLLLDAVLADTGTDGVVLSSSTLNAIADALLDRTAGVETNRTPRQALRLILAAAAGKVSGAGTGTVTIRDTNDGVNRIVATTDDDGNRSAVTLNAS
jgi:hypothetical protein